MSIRPNILSCVVVGFLAGFFLVSNASASVAENSLPFRIRVIGSTDFVCQADDLLEVECLIENGRYGTIKASFPNGTMAEDEEQGVLIEVRNVNGRMGLRIIGAWLPSGTGETIELPRPAGLAGSRICVRDFAGAGFAANDSPCFDAPGQGRVDVPMGSGKLGFYLSDGLFRKIAYEPDRIRLFGLRHTAVMFDHNEPPVVNDDTCQAFEDQRVVCGILANDVDLDGDLLRLVEVSRPLFGSAWISDHGIAYEPPEEWTGVDHFRYFVTDGRATGLADVTVLVDPTNDVPVAVKDVVFVDEDGEGLFDLIRNDHDRDSASLELSAVGQPKHGTATISDGQLRYVPKEDWYGEDKFGYTVSDGSGGEAEGEVKVLVRAINDTPVAKDDSATTYEDSAVSGRVSASDVDGDGLIYFLASRTKNGRIDFAEDGAWTYLPNLEYFGEDSFAFFVTDGHDVSNQAEVTIEITFVDDSNDSKVSAAEMADRLAQHNFRDDYWNECYAWQTDCDVATYYGPRMGDDLGLIAGIERARGTTHDSAAADKLADRLEIYGVPVKKTVLTTADLIWQLAYKFVLRPMFNWFK